MAQQNLTSVITIKGNVDNSVNALSKALDGMGTTLTNIGARINPISQKLIEFGTESVRNYADFDDLMRKIQSVSGMTGTELAVVEQATRDLGKTTRYTAADAADAALILAQLGLDYKQIVDFLPDTLRLAQAGDMSIASATDYLYSSLKSMGYGLEYADILIDQMAKTAAVGATDVDTLGESLTRIGSGLSMFKGGSSEVLTILSAMSEFGEDMRGMQGGTALRNFMLSLAAPAGNRDAVVAMLENVGSSMEELDEIMEDVELRSAAKAIEELGLQVYDSQGNLNGAIDIIAGLRDSVAGLNDEAQYNALAQIFGKRTLTTALNLIKLTDDEWNQLQKDIEDSGGFAQYMADIQEGGLGGALRVLKSQWEEFELSIGDTLSPYVEKVAGYIGDLVTWLSSFDDTTRENWVLAMDAIAAAGPALLAVGAGLQLLAWMATPAGLIATATIGLAALGFVLHNIEQARVTANFGTMELDMETLGGYVDGLTTDFNEAVKSLEKYSAGLDTVTENYKTAGTTLASDLRTAVLTNATLTEDDAKRFMALGDSMYNAVLEGLTLRQDQSSAFWTSFFPEGGSAENEDGFSKIFNINDTHFGNLRAEAYEIGAELRRKMVEALQDGELDVNEEESIMATVERLNRIQAEIADFQNRVEFEKLLHKSQAVSLDSMNEFTDRITEKRDQALRDIEEAYATERATTKLGYDDEIERTSDPAKRRRLTQERDRVLGLADKQFGYNQTELTSQYTQLMAQAWESAIQSSDYGDEYTDVLGFIGKYFSGGQNPVELGDWLGTVDQFALSELGTLLSRVTGELGGLDGFLEMADYYKTSGEKVPEALSSMVDMIAALDAIGSLLQESGLGLFDPIQREELHAIYAAWADLQKNQNTSAQENSAQENITIVKPENQPAQYDATGASVSIESSGVQAVQDSLKALEDSDVTVEVGADAMSAEATIAGLDGKGATVRLDGDDSAIRSMLSGGYRASVSLTSKMSAYAEGGRATEPSIFGEVPGQAEWAIPEEHSQRTASLLKSAASASGFDWSELLSGTEGMGRASEPMTIIYAPTIHAADAAGVEEKLVADKKRLDDWFETKMRRREMTSYHQWTGGERL